MLIAIDGPAGSGKGTVSTFLAKHYNLRHLDTGLLYRSVALRALERNITLSDEKGLVDIANHTQCNELNNPKLKDEETAQAASKIAVIPEIRRILTDKMRHFAYAADDNFSGAILDGRDVGTVVCPNADIKIFVTADERVRMQRRSKEMGQRFGKNADMSHITNRDQRDKTRKVSPMKAAEDAFVLDTTTLNIDEACEKAISIINQATLKKTTTV